jgi:hypothetical protein
MNIQKVQQRLNAELKDVAGYKPITEDGIYGVDTKKSIALFQVKHGLATDGIAGPETLAELFPHDFSYDITAIRPVPALNPGETSLSYRAMQYLIAQNGVRERTGNNDGTAVETFLRCVGLGKGYSWCMAFIYWAFYMASTDTKKYLPLKKTGGCMDQYNFCKSAPFETLSVLHPAAPMVTDIFIIDLHKGAGHTGMITGLNLDGTVSTIEGNTNDNGSANGDGVYERKRNVEKLFALIRISA